MIDSRALMIPGVSWPRKEDEDEDNACNVGSKGGGGRI